MALTFYFNKSKIQIFKVFSGTLDKSIMMHSHTKNSYELHLIDSGRGILETEDARYELVKNILYVTGPNVAHKQTPDKDMPMHELCVYFKILKSKLSKKIMFASVTENSINMKIEDLFNEFKMEREYFKKNK